MARGPSRWLAAAAATTALVAAAGCADSSSASDDDDVIKVGVLHSLSGTMAISEVTVRDATLLAIEEINAAGGVLGKQIEPVVEDGASDWDTFAEKAQKLISQDQVATVFGCWTSASRKAVLPVFEGNNALLWYPVQYEGLEASPNIFYTGATTNQQIIPGLDYLREELGAQRIFLVGSDYVFPRTANLIINAYAEAHGMEVVGEEYAPLGHTEFSTVVNKIVDESPDAVFNTLNGDSNVAFFKQLRDAGLTAESTPTISVSVAEEEVAGIGPENITGHLVAWNYYQTTGTDRNTEFVTAFQSEYGADRVTSDPMQAGYNGVYLWAAAVEAAGSTDVDAVREAAGGISLEAPEGPVTIDGDNQHLYKTARVGVVQPDGLIEEVWNSGEPIKPDPYLAGYTWAEGLS